MKTNNIGRKFHEDGSVRLFPGNTIISKISGSSEIYPLLCEVGKQYQKSLAAGKYAFLPNESYHMTVIQGVCEEDRKQELWSSLKR